METINLSDMPWREIAKKCPLQCRVFDKENDEYNSTDGELTVEELNNGFDFYHQGFSQGKIFVYLYNRETSPDNKKIEIEI